MKSRFRIFWTKLSHWEYWPWYIVYIPVFIYWLWCGIKTRAIFWISAGNPGFDYGGVVGASKYKILAKIPKEIVPIGVLLSPEESIDEIEDKMREVGLSFPVILKPDIGERGFHVALIYNNEELAFYRKVNNEITLMQEYLDLPMELGIFYHRYPSEEHGTVSSIVSKGLLKVKGDGEATIRQLMQKSSRALQQIKRLELEGRVDMESVLHLNEEVLLEPIGNHVRGTKFMNGQSYISKELIEVIDGISRKIDGFYYGRFDIRCESIEALCEGNLKVMELNGVASEPAHIYSPNFPLFDAYKILFHHWRTLYKISKINHSLGTPYMSLKTGIAALRKSRFNR